MMVLDELFFIAWVSSLIAETWLSFVPVGATSVGAGPSRPRRTLPGFPPYPGGGLGSIPRNTASIWLVSWFLRVSTAFSFHQEWRFFVSVRKCLLAHLQLGVPCQLFPRVSCGVEWAAYLSCWPEFTGMLHLVGCFLAVRCSLYSFARFDYEITPNHFELSM